MSSPGGKRRPLSTSDYVPLIQSKRKGSSSDKPKPPPKPKPQFLKSNSAATVTDYKVVSSDNGSSSYFQPGGSGNIGYCLSSVYKAKRTSTEYSTRKSEDSISTKSLDSMSKFVSKDGSRPPLSSLPAKFRVSFEERNRHDNSEPATGVLVAISESNTSIVRRPPPPIPSSKNQGKNILPSTSINPSKSLPTRPRLSSCNLPLTTSSNSLVLSSKAKTSSLERNSPLGTGLTSVSPSISTSSLNSPSSVRACTPTLPITFAQPPPYEMEYTEREHPRNAFEYLQKFRQRGELCDAILVVNDKELKAHRVVLAACSQFFESMFIGEFAEPLNEPVVIEELSEDALETMVEFAYTSRIKLTERNIYSIFEAADLLQFTGVKGACFKFFKQQINKSNCIRTWLFAQSHNCTELLDASLKYIECNFLEIVQGREFLDLDQPEIVTAITSREDLAITSEEQVYDAVLGWVKNKAEKRRKHSLKVFKSVRFPSMSRDYLMYIVDNEPFMKEDPDLLQLLIDGLESHVTTIRGTLKRKAKKESELMDHSNMKPRAASMAVEVVDVHRNNALLGLCIMGGIDRPQHVFRQGDKSGVFILHILEESAAAKVGRLKPGDRILQVNGIDMMKVTHEEAIRILKTSSDPLSFIVRHEPVPAGLKELTLVTKPGEGFGFVITGGVNSYLGNPFDDTDEGIFISQVIPGGTAEQDGRLKLGTRVLQVNSVSMLGKTQEEALKVLQGVLDRLNLLVCDGYDPDAVKQTQNLDEVNLSCDI